jgi:hypothetical protein
MESDKIVYRLGSATNDALTPRSQDLESHPGSYPGLSVDESPPPPGRKAQKIDVALLAQSGLAFFPDDPSQGGSNGHGVIAPIDTNGRVDEAILREWAGCRGTGQRHHFTQGILNAIIGEA